jgi:hypothetical protein
MSGYESIAGECRSESRLLMTSCWRDRRDVAMTLGTRHDARKHQFDTAREATVRKARTRSVMAPEAIARTPTPLSPLKSNVPVRLSRPIDSAE